MAESIQSTPQPEAKASESMNLSQPNIHVELTHSHLDVLRIMSLVKSPEAGAIVLFAGILP
jgi:molybdopterin synthase catalytic subunit